MGITYLERGRHPEGSKKIVYKFTNGKVTTSFRGTAAAAIDAGIQSSSLVNYINKRIKKPRKLPANIEYSYSNKLENPEEQE